MQELLKSWKEFEATPEAKSAESVQNGPTLEIRIPAEFVTSTNRQVSVDFYRWHMLIPSSISKFAFQNVNILTHLILNDCVIHLQVCICRFIYLQEIILL